MSIPKKKSRKVNVDNIKYRWIVGGQAKGTKLEWTENTDLLDSSFIEIAKKYSLGSVAKFTQTIVIELAEDPKSKVLLYYTYYLYDGFMGFEPFKPITNKLIKIAILESLENGWNPSEHKNYEFKKIQKIEELKNEMKPAIPCFINTKNKDYKNVDNGYIEITEEIKPKT